MKQAPIFVIVFFVMAIMCNPLSEGEVKNIKDLDENMIDLRMYHENLGDAIVKQDQDIALWLETGMDSLLNVIADKFEAHRKLSKPFREDYEKNLEPTIDILHEALQRKSWPEARSAYTLLTKKCNNCHLDHEVDKEVQNWLLRE